MRKETRCRHIGYSYRLTARVILYAPSHRQDNIPRISYTTQAGCPCSLAGRSTTTTGDAYRREVPPPPHRADLQESPRVPACRKAKLSVKVASIWNREVGHVATYSPQIACTVALGAENVAIAGTSEASGAKQGISSCRVDKSRGEARPSRVCRWQPVLVAARRRLATRTAETSPTMGSRAGRWGGMKNTCAYTYEPSEPSLPSGASERSRVWQLAAGCPCSLAGRPTATGEPKPSESSEPSLPSVSTVPSGASGAARDFRPDAPREEAFGRWPLAGSWKRSRWSRRAESTKVAAKRAQVGSVAGSPCS